jgi:DNA polymerase-3 subunit alpha
MELLNEHSGGLIALSACLKGTIPYLINRGRIDEATERARELASIFGEDHFYLEVQANTIPEQGMVNRVLQDISKDLSIPMVGTNDCHYLNREDAEAHDALLCIQTGKSIDDPKRMKLSTDDFWLKSRIEMEEVLKGKAFRKALDRTAEVARLCQFEMEFGDYKYPVYQVPRNTSLDELVRIEARKGLKGRLQQIESDRDGFSEDLKQEYEERLEYELDTIINMGFSGYFLIVSDFIDYARQAEIPVGPGRGSAAGSLVAYCLGITNIDPIQYGLIFERFLNPQRISMPDIDIDFCMNGRDEVIRYVAEKYGRDNVAQIITFGTMKARGVIRDVGRTLGIPYGEVDRIAKLVPEGPNVTLKKAMEEEPDLRKLESGEPHQQKLLRIARALEGLSRHASTHASGLVISDRPLVEYLPLFKGPNDEIMTQYTMDQIEKIGLIKFDFLGLKTLTVIKQALALIEETAGEKVDIDRLPLDDQMTYRLCSEGKTTGVFQLESDGMKELLRRLRPEVFEDLIALVALYRPGPLGSNMVDDFISGKHGNKEISYYLPHLEPILKETYGVILYQEQVMKIGQVLANYSLAEADELRKAIGKKKPEVMAKHRARFIQGATENGVPRDRAETLFSLIDKFGGYGFNKSHSAAYALIAYQTAYLKAHYPVQFMTALLTQDMENQDRTIKNIAECREMGIEILPPDLNESQADFAVVGGRIRFGLAAVKNVGRKAVESMIEERERNGPFQGLLDFCRRIEGAKVNRRVLEGLIQCGAFDYMGIARSRLFVCLDDVLRITNTAQDPNQLSIFASSWDEENGSSSLFEYPELEEWDVSIKLKREKEALGFYITGHPLDRFQDEVSRFVTSTIQGLSTVRDKASVSAAGVAESLRFKRTKRGEKMALFNLEDATGSVPVVVFPKVLGLYVPFLKGDEPLVIHGKAEVDDNTVKIIAQEIGSLEAIRQESVGAIELNLCHRPLSRDELEDIRDILFRYPGRSSVLLRINGTQEEDVLIEAHSRFQVLPCSEMVHQIEKIIGEKVIYRYGKKNQNRGKSFHK